MEYIRNNIHIMFSDNRNPLNIQDCQNNHCCSNEDSCRGKIYHFTFTWCVTHIRRKISKLSRVCNGAGCTHRDNCPRGITVLASVFYARNFRERQLPEGFARKSGASVADSRLDFHAGGRRGEAARLDSEMMGKDIWCVARRVFHVERTRGKAQRETNGNVSHDRRGSRREG